MAHSGLLLVNMMVDTGWLILPTIHIGEAIPNQGLAWESGMVMIASIVHIDRPEKRDWHWFWVKHHHSMPKNVLFHWKNWQVAPSMCGSQGFINLAIPEPWRGTTPVVGFAWACPAHGQLDLSYITLWPMRLRIANKDWQRWITGSQPNSWLLMTMINDEFMMDDDHF